MVENQRHLILGRLHEVGQLYLDRVIAYMTGEAFLELEPNARAELLTAVFSATAALSQHTTAALGVAERRLDAHLPELFERLDRLSDICAGLGVVPMSFTFNRYRDLLSGEGQRTRTA